jgi:uncharacterized membrane protein HdeD (DUF308 family)
MATASPPLTPDPMQESLRRLGSHWGWIMFFGLLTLGIGIAAVVWPDRTILVIAVLFGIHLIMMGIFRLVGAFSHEAEGGVRWALAIVGVLGILVGILCLQNVVQTVAVLTIVLGFFWVFDGMVHLIMAIADRHQQSRGLSVVTGVVSLCAGIVVLAYPGSSLFFLAIFLGCWLILFGVLEIVAALRVRKLAKELAA